jgi:predicted metalloprotease
MRWRDMRESDNVEDREGQPAGGALGGGLKIGGLGLVVVVAVSLLLGQNPLQVLDMLPGGGPVVEAPAPPRGATPGAPPRPRDENKEFVARIVGDTEATWGRIFQQSGRRYAPAKLVLFRGAVDSACGTASSAVGPFYCPG